MILNADILLALIIFMTSASVARAENDSDGFPIPKNLREKLNSEVEAGNLYQTKPATKKDRDWKWGEGKNNLTKAEIEATKKIINASKCEFQYYDGTSIEPRRTRLSEPKCKSKYKGSDVLVECAGTVKCKSPLMEFWVVSHCFVRGEQACPSAQECAAKSDFGYKIQSLGSWNDAEVVLNGWYEGVADDQF